MHTYVREYLLNTTMDNKENNRVTKILIVGEPQTGKTALIHTFMATEISKLRAQGKNYVRDSVGP